MKIDCISDLHGDYPKLEGGDLLIVAGDLTGRDLENEYALFDYWLNDQKYNAKIVIGGNHDRTLQEKRFKFQFGTYIQDSGCSFNGFKIWGSPWTPTFYNWYFMKDRGEQIKERWDLIPDDIDILITHGPPYGTLDKVSHPSRKIKFSHTGCEELKLAVERVKPKLHVFGHIHEGYGIIEKDGTIFVNCSLMNEHYETINKPITVYL